MTINKMTHYKMAFKIMTLATTTNEIMAHHNRRNVLLSIAIVIIILIGVMISVVLPNFMAPLPSNIIQPIGSSMQAGKC
jgi:hypothetical protein